MKYKTRWCSTIKREKRNKDKKLYKKCYINNIAHFIILNVENLIKLVFFFLLKKHEKQIYICIKYIEVLGSLH